jgi:hypothetical protein
MKKQIAEAYINAAEEAINKSIKSKWSKKRFLSYLDKKYLDSGVCHFSREVLNRNVYNQVFIRKYSIYNNYWCSPPFYGNSPKEIREYLQYRINILKTWL